MWSSWTHGRRIAALTVIGTAIVLPLVLFPFSHQLAKALDIAGQLIHDVLLDVDLRPILGRGDLLHQLFKRPLSAERQRIVES